MGGGGGGGEGGRGGYTCLSCDIGMDLPVIGGFTTFEKEAVSMCPESHLYLFLF